MGIVDAHVHLLPPRLAARVRRVFDEHLPGRLAYPTPDPDPVLDDLLAAGAGAAWVLPYAHAPGVAEWLVPAAGAHVAELAARSPRLQLVLGTTAHPGDGDPAAGVRQAVVRDGARVLKLHCAVGGFTADDPRLDPVWALCTTLALPVVVHVGKHVGGTSAASDLDELGRVAERFPDVPLVLAHTGFPAVDAALELLATYPNVHADLTPVVAATPSLTDDQLVRHADRLLFGSDAPNTGVRIPEQLAAWRAREIPGDALAAILGGNAERLVAGVDA